MSKEQFLQLFSQAIATMEGFYVKGSIAELNNNPGNLRSWGDRPINRGFAQFPDESSGFKALQQQIDKNIFTRKLSLREFFGGKLGVYPGYAPKADKNNPDKYAKFVMDFINKKSDLKIKSVDEILALRKFIWQQLKNSTKTP